MNQKELYKGKHLEKQTDELHLLRKAQLATKAQPFNHRAVKLVNYYGEELKSKGLPMVPCGVWAFACILQNNGMKTKDVSKMMTSFAGTVCELFDEMNRKYKSLTAKTMSDDDLDKWSDGFRKKYWPKEIYLKQKNNGNI